MKLGIKKSTPEQVEEMMKLYREGWSLLAIGRKFNRDHSVVLYWAKKKNYWPRKGITSSFKANGEPFSVEKKPIEKRPELGLDLCLKCRKEKTDPRWKKTRWCCLKHWDEYHYPPKFVY